MKAFLLVGFMSSSGCLSEKYRVVHGLEMKGFSVPHEKVQGFRGCFDLIFGLKTGSHEGCKGSSSSFPGFAPRASHPDAILLRHGALVHLHDQRLVPRRPRSENRQPDSGRGEFSP